MEGMKYSKAYGLFLFALAVGIAVMSCADRIFPVMSDDEYFVDENGIIHNNRCPYRHVPWFTSKKSKYDFMKETEQEFCNECFTHEEERKMMLLHGINLNNEALRLERLGASEEYINERLMKYEREPK